MHIKHNPRFSGSKITKDFLLVMEAGVMLMLSSWFFAIIFTGFLFQQIMIKFVHELSEGTHINNFIFCFISFFFNG